ncbi:hypothetical protein [Neisseria sp. Ec49-e6-T10]|uniref:hypothetical protein n=1 Tax=Neisseria sp. Ec49-e6-T10 TaxID=3140744 RepID=UPI003EC0AB73
MANHKLTAGKQLIEGIVQLGSVLGYHVEEEFPVDESSHGESPAVDVAWFSQKGNRFPLFIFEVESKATNGMTNNPLKVYAQENREFEKPLFFFHIVAQGGSHSVRPRNLEAQYGKNNYRVYLVGSNTANELIKDVLTQHVRVRNNVNYFALHDLFTSELWLKKVDYPQLLMHAVKLGLSKENVISSYVTISRHDSRIFADLIELITADSKENFANTNLDSCLGAQWGIPIITALLCGLSKDPKYWSSLLLEWQRNSCYMPMITPRFGLSSDYDEFILGLAPQLITLCIALSFKHEDICLEFVGVLTQTLDRVGICWAGLNSAIYLLHISSAINSSDSFEKAKSYLLDFKALSEENVFLPPSAVSVITGDFKDYFQQGEIIKIPEIKQFAEQCMKRYQKEKINTEAMALRALDDDSYIFEWSTDLLIALWSTY